jgi:hypothetical protein
MAFPQNIVNLGRVIGDTLNFVPMKGTSESLSRIIEISFMTYYSSSLASNMEFCASESIPPATFLALNPFCKRIRVAL